MRIKSRLRALALCLGLLAPGAAVATVYTQAVTVTSKAWVNLGAGPLAIGTNSYVGAWIVASDSAPNASPNIAGFGTVLSRNVGPTPPIQTFCGTTNYWALAIGGSPAAPASTVLNVTPTNCAGAGSQTVTGSVAVTSPPNYNGSGSTTHSASVTAYTGNQAFANNTSGNLVPAQIAITGTNAGTGFIMHGVMESSGTNAPPSITLWLYSAAPTVASLADYSAYLGPYAADLTNNVYIGSLTCASWQRTNDATAQYFSECSTSNGVTGMLPFQAAAAQTYIYAIEEIGGAYTPSSSEKHTYLLSTLRNN